MEKPKDEMIIPLVDLIPSLEEINSKETQAQHFQNKVSPESLVAPSKVESSLLPIPVQRLLGLIPTEWKESPQPYFSCNKHVLDLISDFGVWKTEPKPKVNADQSGASGSSCSSNATPAKKRLYCIPSIMDIVNIDPIEETFTIKFRIYLVWEVDLDSLGMGCILSRVEENGHFSPMTRDEIEEFEKRTPMPGVCIFNAIEAFDTDPADIRVYGARNVKGFTHVMWNKAYHVKIRERWELKQFPFDQQDLGIALRLNDSRSWDLFDLTVCSVQFHREALCMTEYYPLIPKIVRESPAHKATKVCLRVRRIPTYYLQNIVLIMFLLSLLGPLAFIVEVEDLGDRLSTILTLLLTAVAFKYVISSSLPKVPYNTLIDYFILCSTISLAAVAFFAVVPRIVLDDWGKETANFVNKILGISCISFSLLLPFAWGLFVLTQVSRRGTQDLITLIPGKTWYNYQFSPAPFIDDSKTPK